VLKSTGIMANLPGSKKRWRQTKKRTTKNLYWKDQIGVLAKEVRGLERGKKLNEAPEEFLLRAKKVVDKAAQKGIIHKNKAARLKSRWTKRVLEA